MSRSDALRTRAEVFKIQATEHGAGNVVTIAAASGIDITYFDETVPFGEVCGYSPVSVTDDHGQPSGYTFFAVRRVRNDCFGGPDPYFLVSDHMLQAYLMHGNKCPYITPPRYEAGVAPRSFWQGEHRQPSSYCKRLRDSVEGFNSSKLIGDWNVSNAGITMADLTNIDDSAPCGEVSGYHHAYSQTVGTFKDMFYAIRRMRNDCFPYVADDFLFVSDEVICSNFVHPAFRHEYKTPPRWKPEVK